MLLRTTVASDSYLQIGALSLKIRVFHELIVLLAVRVLVENLRSYDYDLISECGEGR